ncbi:MAG: fatty acid desaturase, partial [Myxococcota bacterium]
MSSTQLQRALLRYAEPKLLRSAAQLFGNLAGYFGLWVAMWWASDVSLVLSFVLALPLVGFVLRIFSIQHDCGHGAFFRSRDANDWTGRVLSVLTLVPYAYWRSAHATHHATIGRLDRRGIGEIDVLTAREYADSSWLQRLGYRAYRNPIVLFGIGPSYQFYLRFRLPFNLPEPAREARHSILAMNLALAAIGLAIHATLGLGSFLLLYLPVM